MHPTGCVYVLLKHIFATCAPVGERDRRLLVIKGEIAEGMSNTRSKVIFEVKEEGPKKGSVVFFGPLPACLGPALRWENYAAECMQLASCCVHSKTGLSDVQALRNIVWHACIGIGTEVQ